MDDVKALSICYKLLSRMNRRTQRASLDWLASRLESDEHAAEEVKAGLSRSERKSLSAAVGEAALSLVSLLHATGAASGRRDVEMRGPLDADVTVCVRKVKVS